MNLEQILLGLKVFSFILWVFSVRMRGIKRVLSIMVYVGDDACLRGYERVIKHDLRCQTGY